MYLFEEIEIFEIKIQIFEIKIDIFEIKIEKILKIFFLGCWYFLMFCDIRTKMQRKEGGGGELSHTEYAAKQQLKSKRRIAPSRAAGFAVAKTQNLVTLFQFLLGSVALTSMSGWLRMTLAASRNP